MHDAGPSAELWQRRSPLASSLRVAELLSGVDAVTLDDAVVLALSASKEASDLLDGMEVRVRTLTTTVTTTPERCDQSVRGPILWSETIVARAGALGNDEVFICARTERCFDTPENRVLVAALSVLARSGSALRRELGSRLHSETQKRVAAASAEANSWLHHRRLSGISSTGLRRGDVGRLRTGHRSGQAAPLLAIQRRMAEPFTAEDVATLCSQDAQRLHQRVVDALGPTSESSELITSGDFLVIGHIRFRNGADYEVLTPEYRTR